MGTIQTARAQLADADAIGLLQRQVHDLHVANVGWYFRTVSAAQLADVVRIQLEQPDCRAFVAREDNVVVGFVLGFVRAQEEREMAFAQHSLYLDQIGVDSRVRRRGIGRLLVERFVADAREDGVARVDIDTWEFNVDARAFFASLGFGPKTRCLSRVVDGESGA